MSDMIRKTIVKTVIFFGGPTPPGNNFEFLGNVNFQFLNNDNFEFLE